MSLINKEKEAIIKMFKEPINEVEEALEEIIDEVILRGMVTFDLSDFAVLRIKIKNLKGMIPTVQEEI